MLFSSITTYQCKHLVIDAGHISVESNLVEKKVLREIQLKRNQQYSDEDYKRLESLMYDKMSIRLEAAQARFGSNFNRRSLLTCEISSL